MYMYYEIACEQALFGGGGVGWFVSLGVFRAEFPQYFGIKISLKVMRREKYKYSETCIKQTPSGNAVVSA